MKPSILPLSVSDLRLDPDNPRLPEDMQGAESQHILEYLHDTAVLEELIQSFADNGFFEHEPLVVWDDPSVEGYVVVEGNRRLAALSILLQLEVAQDAEIAADLEEPLDPERLSQLRTIPCYVVESRDAVHRFLGFRHIGGLKTWPSESKARYILVEIEKLNASGFDGNPFASLGRRVGTNAQGIRPLYLALKILHFAKSEFGIDVHAVSSRRFGVWMRCMSAPLLMQHIGFTSPGEGAPTSVSAVEDRLQRIDGPNLREVIGDLTPERGGKALLRDSRDISTYSAVLASEHAHGVLRSTNDFELAAEVVARAGVSERVSRLERQVRLIREQVELLGSVDADAVEPASRLVNASRGLQAAIVAFANELSDGDLVE